MQERGQQLLCRAEIDEGQVDMPQALVVRLSSEAADSEGWLSSQAGQAQELAATRQDLAHTKQQLRALQLTLQVQRLCSCCLLPHSMSSFECLCVSCRCPLGSLLVCGVLICHISQKCSGCRWARAQRVETVRGLTHPLCLRLWFHPP